MITKWIYIECIFINKWALPIHAVINEEVKKSNFVVPSSEFYELAMSISIRIDMVGRIIDRLTQSIMKINKIIDTHTEDHINTPVKEGYALYIDDDLKMDLLIDVDAFLFEINSCCELIGKYMIELYKSKGIEVDGREIGRHQAKVLRDAGLNTSWFKQLDRSRNFFIHNGAPYIAIDISEEPNRNIIIMKENLKSFEDPTKYITLSTLVDIREGFKAALPALQKYLKEIVKQ